MQTAEDAWHCGVRGLVSDCGVMEREEVNLEEGGGVVREAGGGAHDLLLNELGHHGLEAAPDFLDSSKLWVEGLLRCESAVSKC